MHPSSVSILVILFVQEFVSALNQKGGGHDNSFQQPSFRKTSEEIRISNDFFYKGGTSHVACNQTSDCSLKGQICISCDSSNPNLRLCVCPPALPVLVTDGIHPGCYLGSRIGGACNKTKQCTHYDNKTICARSCICVAGRLSSGEECKGLLGLRSSQSNYTRNYVIVLSLVVFTLVICYGLLTYSKIDTGTTEVVRSVSSSSNLVASYVPTTQRRGNETVTLGPNVDNPPSYDNLFHVDLNQSKTEPPPSYEESCVAAASHRH